MYRLTPHGLKAQKHLAQGNTLGKKGRSHTPCKGKSFLDPFIKLEYLF